MWPRQPRFDSWCGHCTCKRERGQISQHQHAPEELQLKHQHRIAPSDEQLHPKPAVGVNAHARSKRPPHREGGGWPWPTGCGSSFLGKPAQWTLRRRPGHRLSRRAVFAATARPHRRARGPTQFANWARAPPRDLLAALSRGARFLYVPVVCALHRFLAFSLNISCGSLVPVF